MSSSSENGPPQGLDKPLNILVFGGNGFMGSEVVSRLLEYKIHKLTLVSRGNWYFDAATRIKPFVHHIYCDRDSDIEDYCTEFTEFVKNSTFFDVLIDFSGYKPEYLENALDLLVGKIGLYIYISTDSVYEVSKKYDPPAKETDAVRPEDPEEREALNENDSYGDEKLGGEEVLENRLREKGGPNYLILRLPDVVGPRDTTDRWWQYQLWVQLYSYINVRVPIPEEIRELKTSLVYSKDVANAMIAAIKKGPSVYNTCYNIAFEKEFLLKEIIQYISKKLNMPIQFNMLDADAKFNYHLFPSVTRGAVDISKAKAAFGFEPTNWETAFDDIIQFYKDAFHSFPSERDDVVHQLTRVVIPRDKKGEFLGIIEQLATSNPGPKTEL